MHPLVCIYLGRLTIPFHETFYVSICNIERSTDRNTNFDIFQNLHVTVLAIDNHVMKPKIRIIGGRVTNFCTLQSTLWIQRTITGRRANATKLFLTGLPNQASPFRMHHNFVKSQCCVGAAVLVSNDVFVQATERAELCTRTHPLRLVWSYGIAGVDASGCRHDTICDNTGGSTTPARIQFLLISSGITVVKRLVIANQVHCCQTIVVEQWRRKSNSCRVKLPNLDHFAR